ncbi:MAG: triphosphoribosyl-dephospho-CoA synthase [Chloroflexi bacterium]|nr:triphosphoribosyl-dephospho-CoA synthase [Chloroflexota bacterium]
MRRLKPDEVAQAAQIACLLEVSADKPGNVTRHEDFWTLRQEDFLISAVAIGPAIREAGEETTVGDTILRAIRNTHRFVSYNTNLGIVLLFAPLAKAYGRPGRLRESLREILASLTVNDAQKAYEAIRLAKPAGMGRLEKYDISEEQVDITLREAMWLAKDRDSLAREYVTNFESTFELGYPSLMKYWVESHQLLDSIVQAYLAILTEIPDTQISRINGPAVAEDVSRRAARALELGGVFSARGRKAVRELDRFLRQEGDGLNPGTTADLVTASIFVALLRGGLYQMPCGTRRG